MAKSPNLASALRRPDNPEQSKAFIEKAQGIEADEKNSAADELMERPAKTNPAPRKQK
jgi:hypothetical protein